MIVFDEFWYKVLRINRFQCFEYDFQHLCIGVKQIKQIRASYIFQQLLVFARDISLSVLTEVMKHGKKDTDGVVVVYQYLFEVFLNDHINRRARVSIRG